MNRSSIAFVVIALLAAFVFTFIVLHDGVDGVHKDSLHPYAKPRVDRDLVSIRVDTLRVLALRDPITWERITSGERGLEWELLQRFAEHRELLISVVPVEDPDSLLPMLQRGEGDIVAAQLSEADPRSSYMEHTSMYRRTAPVIVFRAHDPRDTAPSAPIDTVHLAWRGPFGMRGAELGKALDAGMTLVLDSVRSEEDLVEAVALGGVDAAVISEARAVLLATRLPQLRYGEALAASAPLVFGTRSNAKRLLRSVNAWLRNAEELEPRMEVIASYTNKLPKGSIVRRHIPPTFNGALTPFDSLFKAGAELMSWDWRLLAAVAFGESGFDTTAVSYKGATGLMQMMPGTAGSLGLDSIHLIDQQVKGAALYLALLDTMWIRRIPERTQRLRFVLASYNAGPGHVIDAQVLANILDLDPTRWEQNVERAMLLLAFPRYYMRPEIRNGHARGSDTFLYVRQVLHLHEHYTQRTVPPFVMVPDSVVLP